MPHRPPRFWLQLLLSLLLAAVAPYALMALEVAGGLPRGLGLPAGLVAGMAGVALFPSALRPRVYALVLYVPFMASALGFWGLAVACIAFGACAPLAP